MGVIDIENVNRPPVEVIIKANPLSSLVITITYQLQLYMRVMI